MPALLAAVETIAPQPFGEATSVRNIRLNDDENGWGWDEDDEDYEEVDVDDEDYEDDDDSDFDDYDDEDEYDEIGRSDVIDTDDGGGWLFRF